MWTPEVLSTLVTLIIAGGTLYVNWRISSAKNQIEGRATTSSAEAEFREDLLVRLKELTQLINEKEAIITALKESVIALKEESSTLRYSAKQDQREMAELHGIVDKIEKRVYYTGEKNV